MLTILTKLIPFRDWLYAGLAIAATVFWFHHDHVEQVAGAAKVTAAVKEASAKADAKAAAQIAALNDQHATQLAKVKEVYDNAITSAAAQHDADLERLRHITAGRDNGGHPSLGSPTPAAPTADSGDHSFASLGAVAAGLADALRQDDAALGACYADRDALTGK
jgi:hypothetical protein